MNLIEKTVSTFGHIFKFVSAQVQGFEFAQFSDCIRNTLQIVRAKIL